MKRFLLSHAKTFLGFLIGISLAANAATVYDYFSPGGALTGTWNSQNVNLGAGAPFIVGNLPVTNLNSGTSASNATFWRGDGTWSAPGAGTPAGADTQVQYNNAGAFGAEAGFTYNQATNVFVADTMSAASQYRINNLAAFDAPDGGSGPIRCCAQYTGLKLTNSNTEIVTFNHPTATGAQTATFVASNKPGTGTAGPIAWIPVDQAGSIFGYIPIFGP